MGGKHLVGNFYAQDSSQLMVCLLKDSTVKLAVRAGIDLNFPRKTCT